jgi:K+-transporting ATPase ATPase C chain
VFQAARIALARGVPVDQVEALIVQHTEQPALGLIGERRVNVLRLNLALDEAEQGNAS